MYISHIAGRSVFTADPVAEKSDPKIAVVDSGKKKQKKKKIIARETAERNRKEFVDVGAKHRQAWRHRLWAEDRQTRRV